MAAAPLVRRSRYRPPGRKAFDLTSANHYSFSFDDSTPGKLLSLYRSIFGSMRDAAFVADEHWRIRAVNNAFIARTGYGETEAVGSPPPVLDAADRRTFSLEAAKASMASSGKWTGEVQCVHKEGTVSAEWLTVQTIGGADGLPLCYMGTFLDHETFDLATAKLRLHAQVFSHASEGIMITDTQLTILSVNGAFTVTTGYTEEEAVGRTPRLLHSGVQNQAFYSKMWASIHEAGFWQGEIWNRRKNGEVYPEWLWITTLRNDQGRITNYIGMFSDITERKQYEDRLIHLAHFDKLTGLPNRTLLADKLPELTSRARDTGRLVAVLFIDLDRFKTVNDSLGHNAGDKLLRKIAGRLSSVVREADIVCRLGGDEFIVALPDLSQPEEALHTARELINHIKRPIRLDETDLYLDASIGISLYPNHGGDFETLIKHADLAMYQAKLQRSGCEMFNAAISSAFLRKLEVENELRWAIAREQLTMHYQPQVRMVGGTMDGLEALLRWHHPTLGSVSPAEFIPIAEETGSIVEIGKWVLKEVCRQLNRWLEAGFAVPSVAVNLSARQFRWPDLLVSIRSILHETGCDPRKIVLEITESISMHDIESVLPLLHELRTIGFRIAVDDFGKGHSALGYLKQFPIDILKIDKSFVQELTNNAKSAVITKAIIDMAHGMDLRVIAEGVETAEQMESLRLLQCDMVQGYAIDRPMPSEQLRRRYDDSLTEGGRTG